MGLDPWSKVTGNSSVTLSVADSIALYCAQHNKNESFNNRFITFSNRPQMVDISMCQTLRDKLRRLHRFDDYSNTDIEATFDLILDTVVKIICLKKRYLHRALLFLICSLIRLQSMTIT